MIFQRTNFIALAAVMLMLCSCASTKDIAYFQNKLVDQPEKIDKHAGILIQPKDQLSIVVSSRNPELVAMFNLPVVSYQAGSEVVAGAGQLRLLGYVVDNDGYIDFPVLGKLYVAGLTRWQLAEMIKDKLIKDGLLSDAVVTVEFMNFKVSVMGEVTSPGTYTIQGDKVTVLQALSLARDLTIFGKRDKVSVIREQDGERVIYEIDLTDVDMFKSPAYYLQRTGRYEDACKSETLVVDCGLTGLDLVRLHIDYVVLLKVVGWRLEHVHIGEVNLIDHPFAVLLPDH